MSKAVELRRAASAGAGGQLSPARRLGDDELDESCTRADVNLLTMGDIPTEVSSAAGEGVGTNDDGVLSLAAAPCKLGAPCELGWP